MNMKKRGTRLKKIIAILTLLVIAIPGVTRAAMGITVYGSLKSGDWNPFVKDTAKTKAYVGWDDSSATGGTKIKRDNKVTVKTVITWTDKKGKIKNTQNIKYFTDVAGYTSTVSAKSGNDKSTATSYHYAYVKDKLSNKAYYEEASYVE